MSLADAAGLQVRADAVLRILDQAAIEVEIDTVAEVRVVIAGIDVVQRPGQRRIELETRVACGQETPSFRLG